MKIQKTPTRCINRLHQKKTRNNTSVWQLNIMDFIPNCMPLLGIADSEWVGYIIIHVRLWDEMKLIPGSSTDDRTIS